MRYGHAIVLLLVSLAFAGTVQAQAQKQKVLPPRESMEWCSINSYDASSTDLPRVLLIGDSITGRYASAVREGIKGKAYLSVLSTSKAVGDPALLDEVRTICNQYTYAVVHFNNGLHGGGGERFRKNFPDLVATIKKHAPGAKLVWATTTPCKGEGGMTMRAREVNQMVAEYIKTDPMTVNDLYGLVMKNIDNPKVLWDGGGIHFTAEGAALQGKQVAESVLSQLPVKPL